jgi:signal peptidase II
MGGIALLVLAADQVSKSLVLAAHPAAAAGSGWVSVRLVRNTGSAGGLVAGHPVLVTLAAVAITAVAAGLALRARERLAAACLAAVIGGAAGNLSDRIFRAPGLGRGGVVDWIHFGGSGGSMDVADIAIQFGVLGAIIAMLVGDRVRRGREDRQTAEAGQTRAPGRAGEAGETRLGASGGARAPRRGADGTHPRAVDRQGERRQQVLVPGQDGVGAVAVAVSRPAEGVEHDVALDVLGRRDDDEGRVPHSVGQPYIALPLERPDVPVPAAR